MATTKKTNSKKKITTGEIVAIVFFIIITLGIAGFYFYTERKRKLEAAKNDNEKDTTTKTTTTTSTKASRNDNFPLQFGSLGERVKTLQKALISKFGVSILPKYGADGDFGTETKNALISKGLPTVLFAAELDTLIKSSTTPISSTATIDYRKDAARLKTAFDDISGTDNTTVRDLLKPSRNSNYIKNLRDTYDKYYGGQGALLTRLKSEQDFNEFTDIINNLETL